MRDVENDPCADLDGDALLIAARETGIPTAAAARLIARYRAEVETLEIEPEWRSQMHMHGPGWSCSTYAAEGTQVTMTVWSYAKGEGETAYGIPGRQKGFPTYREAVAALNGRSYRSGPRSAQEAPRHGE